MSTSAAGEASDALDPRTAAQIIDDSRKHVADAIYPNTRAIYVVWAIAWFVAMGAGYIGMRGDGPFGQGVGMTIYAVALIAAFVFNIVQVARTNRGVGGRSQVYGTRWGISWGIAAAGFGLFMSSMSQLVPEQYLAQLYDTLPPIIGTAMVGALYLQGGAYWPQSHMLVLGWMLLPLAGGALLFGPVTFMLALAIGGAAIFTIGAVISRPQDREMVGV